MIRSMSYSRNPKIPAPMPPGSGTPLASHFSCWRRCPPAPPPAEHLVNRVGQHQHDDRDQHEDDKPGGEMLRAQDITGAVQPDTVTRDRHDGLGVAERQVTDCDCRGTALGDENG